MSKVLVAGGAGFIGSFLCKKLLEENHEVICLDNLLTGDKENIEELLPNQRFQFITGDVRIISRSKLPSSISYVYNLASPASVTYISDHPIDAATVNSIGLLNLLNYTLEKKARLLFASSSEAYGDPKVHPQKESYFGNVNCVGVRSGYDEGKRFGEALCMGYFREKKVDVRIARIFNTYGPNSHPRDSRVIPRFITQALKGEDLTVHGNGTQTRSLCFVSDLVDGLMKLMESNEVYPVNLGNPEEYTILQIAKRVIEKTDSVSRISFVDRPPDDPSVRKPDISKAREKLSFNPQVTFDQGLAETISYFKKKLKNTF